MALRKTWTIPAGKIVKTSVLGGAASQIASKFVPLASELTVQNAYIKITNIHGGKDQLLVKYTVMIESDEVDSGHASFTPSLDGKNFIAQGYEYMKTLPEFINTQDC
jgi:hypothetical protein